MDTKEIREALERATQGEWDLSKRGCVETEPFRPIPIISPWMEDAFDEGQPGHEDAMANMHLIANAPRWLRELCDEVERYRWKPIETAPRDGTKILGNSTYSGVYVAQMSYTNGQWWIEKLELPDEPTHWMPLPDPPGSL